MFGGSERNMRDELRLRGEKVKERDLNCGAQREGLTNGGRGEKVRECGYFSEANLHLLLCRQVLR